MSRPATIAAGLGLIAFLSACGSGILLIGQQWQKDLEIRLEQNLDVNARLAAALTQTRQMRDVDATRGVASFAADYLESPQDSIATADLQNLLRTMALEKHVDLSTLNTLTPRQAGDVTFVGVRLTFRAPLPIVQAVLHATETAQPLLFIERLGIRADVALQRNTIDAADHGPVIAVEMDVFAPKRPRALATAVAPPVRIEPAPRTEPAQGGARP